MAPLGAVFVVGLVEGCGGRALVFVVELAGAAVVDADDELPSGAVESIVVCWSDAAVSEVLWIVDGRVGFVTDGFTVDRAAAVVVELGVGFGLAAAVEVVGLGGTSR